MKDNVPLQLDFGADFGRPATKSRYEKHRDRVARQQSELSAEGRDIGEIPTILNPERRESCKKDLRLFCETYFPHIFYLPWSPIQLEVLARLQASALEGGNFALAMPRSTGKTTLCECTAIWSTIYGYRRYVVIIGAESESAREIFKSIKDSLEFNEDLIADFPEICYPVIALEGIMNRCKGQTWRGMRTNIQWSDSKLVFPTIGDAITSGSIIVSTSMTSRIRGMKHNISGNESVRPDFVIVDDPQTRESAKSSSQVKYRKDLINGDISGLAGPGKTIAIVVPCTVIYPGDLADQLLDREENPEWRGKRFKLLNGFPKNMHLWQRYRDLRAEGLRQDKGTATATRFYIAHRDQMDEGCHATWAERFLAGEVSGIQYAMNLYFDDSSKFFSEYQNEPLAADLGDGDQIVPELILAKMNKRARLEIPQAVSRLTMMVDVQKNLLYYTIMGFDERFGSHLLAYGTYPEQANEIFSHRDASPTYLDTFPGAGQEGALTQALRELIPPLLAKSYMREDGAELSIGRCLIDSGWGEQADTVYNFIRESGWRSVLMPSKGVGVGATYTPYSEFKRKPGEIISDYEWHIAPIKAKRHVKLMRYDTNWWKSFFRNRVMTAQGDYGAFSVNEQAISDRFRMLADHLSSEYSVTESAKGRRVDIWKLTPNRENDWLDCVIGCMVAASEQGCRLIIDPATASGKEPARPVPPVNPVTSGRKTYGVRKVYGLTRK